MKEVRNFPGSTVVIDPFGSVKLAFDALTLTQKRGATVLVKRGGAHDRCNGVWSRISDGRLMDAGWAWGGRPTGGRKRRDGCEICMKACRRPPSAEAANAGRRPSCDPGQARVRRQLRAHVRRPASRARCSEAAVRSCPDFSDTIVGDRHLSQRGGGPSGEISRPVMRAERPFSHLYSTADRDSGTLSFAASCKAYHSFHSESHLLEGEI